MVCKSQGLLSTYSTQAMPELDPNYNADLLDAMADMAYEQEQAMREEYELNPPELETYDDQA